MKKSLASIAAVVTLACGIVWGQTPSGASVVRLDPALDVIISSNAKFEVISKGPSGTEGPVWVKNGQFLLFTERGKSPHGQVDKLLPDGTSTMFHQPTDNAIGMAMDGEGRLVLCSSKSLVRVEKDGKHTILADQYEGRPFTGVNDLAVNTSDGSIYFTDDATGVYRWNDGKLQHLIKAMTTPAANANGRQGRIVNGIALSPDNRFLYVVMVPPLPTPRRILRYELRPDGTIIGVPRPGKILSDERPWMPLPDQVETPSREWGQPDGIKVDRRGNVYFGGPDTAPTGEVRGPGGVWIVSQDGKHLGTILIPGGENNLVFGDADGKGLYFTLGTGLGKIRLNAPAI